MNFNRTSDIGNFYAGDNINWTVNFSEFKPTDNYNLSLVLVHPTNDKISLTAVSDTSLNLFSFIVSNVDSGAFVPGKYNGYFKLTRSSDSFVKQMEIGFVEIFQNIADIVNLDTSTHAQKVLQSIKDLLEDKILSDVANYTINGRSLTKMTFDELIKLKVYYEKEVNKELTKKDLEDNGKSKRNKLTVLFNPPWGNR